MTKKTEDAAADAPVTDVAPETAPEGDTPVRVLVDHAGHKVNDIVLLTEQGAAQAVAEGWGDAHPDAVAYAQSLA